MKMNIYKNKTILITGASSGIGECFAKNLDILGAKLILTAEASLTNKKEHIYQAAMLDPLTASNLSIDEIYKMTDEMIEAHGSFLPNYI